MLNLLIMKKFQKLLREAVPLENMRIQQKMIRRSRIVPKFEKKDLMEKKKIIILN